MSSQLGAACRDVDSVLTAKLGCRCGTSGHMRLPTAAQKCSLDTSITSSKTCSSAPGLLMALRCEAMAMFMYLDGHVIRLS